MKKIITISSFFLIGSLLAGDDDWSLNNHLTFTGDFVYYRRSTMHRRNLIYDQAEAIKSRCGVCQAKPTCTTSTVARNFGFEPGLKIGASWVGRLQSWEGIYIYLDGWKGNCHRTSPGALFFSLANPTFLHDFENADHAEASYHSHFESAELNYLRHVSPKRGDYVSVSWILGVRYFHTRETFKLEYVNSGSRSTYDIATQDRTAALQAGFDVQWNPTRYLSWDLIVKGGGGYDSGKQKTLLRDFGNSVTIRDLEVPGHSWPFFIDISLSPGYQILEWFNLHIGFQMIYLNGVCWAPDQLVKLHGSAHRIKMIGNPLIYGLNGGLTLGF